MKSILKYYLHDDLSASQKQAWSLSPLKSLHFLPNRTKHSLRVRSELRTLPRNTKSGIVLNKMLKLEAWTTSFVEWVSMFVLFSPQILEQSWFHVSLFCCDCCVKWQRYNMWKLKALIVSCRKIEGFCKHSHPSGTRCSLIISHRLLNKVGFTSPWTLALLFCE